MARTLRLCPKCRGKVQPNDGKKVGAWWCPRCDWCYTDLEITEFTGNQPGAKVIQFADRRRSNA